MSKRWKIFAVLSFMYVLAYFYRVSMAVMAKDLTRELDLTAAQLGTLSGIFFYSFAFCQLPLGPLLDRFGGKKVVLLSGIVTTLGVILFSLSSSYQTALAGRILMGAGSASVLMGALKVFTNWFDRSEFARISGFIMAVGNIGNLSATTPLALAIAGFGWRTSFLSVAVLQVICLLLVQRTVREQPSEPVHHEEPHPAGRSPLTGMALVVRTPSYWLMSGLAFFWYANYMAVQGLWGGPYLMELLGMTRGEAGSYLLATAAGFLVGCIFVGRVTDSLFRSPKRTMLVGQFVLLCFMTLFLGVGEMIPRPLLFGLFFLMGIAVSSGVAIYPLIRESFPHAIIGTALTAVNFFILLGAATTQQVMGWYIERFPRGPAGYPAAAYHGAFLIPVCGLALALLLFMFVKEPRSEAR
jgi:sugar phosphate permease